MLCPICRESANDITPADNSDCKVVECPGCGTFEISNSTDAIFEKTDEASRRAALDNAKARAKLGERPLVVSSEHPVAVEHIGTETTLSEPQSSAERMSRLFASILKTKGNIRLYLVVSTLWVIGAVIYIANNHMGDEQLLNEAINTTGNHCVAPPTTYESCVNTAGIANSLGSLFVPRDQDADDLSLLPYQNIKTFEDYKNIKYPPPSKVNIPSEWIPSIATSQRATPEDDKQLYQEYLEIKRKLDAQKIKKETARRSLEKKCKQEADSANTIYGQCMSDFEGRVNARRAEIERNQSASDILAIAFVPVIVPLFAAICIVIFFFFQEILKWVSEGYKNSP